MGAHIYAIACQLLSERETQRISQVWCQDSDLSWSNLLDVYQVTDLISYPIQHLGMETHASLIGERRARITTNVLPRTIESTANVIGQGAQIWSGHMGVWQRDATAAIRSKSVSTFRVCPQEGPITGIIIAENERRFAMLQPLPYEIMGHGRVFLHVVSDEVPIHLKEITTTFRQRQQGFMKELNAQGEIEQIVGQAELAEDHGRLLSLVVDATATTLSPPGILEPLGDLGEGESHNSSLVEIVQDLPHQSSRPN